MAIVKYGAIVTEIKGKLGGHVFQRIGKSLGIRQNPHHNPPTSDGAVLSRTQFRQIATAWSNLSMANRATWKNAAASYPAFDGFGNPFNLSGYQLYMRANRYCLLSGRPIITTGTSYLPPALSGVDDDGMSVSTSQWPILKDTAATSQHVFLFFLSMPVAPSTSHNSLKYSYMFRLQYDFNSGDNRYNNLPAWYRNMLYVGALVGYRVIKLNFVTGNFIEDGGVVLITT